MARQKRQDRYFSKGRLVTEQEFMGILWLEKALPAYPALPAPEKVLMLPSAAQSLTPPSSSSGVDTPTKPQCLGGEPKPIIKLASRVGFKVTVPGWGNGVYVSNRTLVLKENGVEQSVTFHQVKGAYGVVWRRWDDLVVLDDGVAVKLEKAA